MMRRILIGLFVVLLSPQAVFACQCAEPAALSRDVIDSYDIVFVGTVIAVTHDETEGRAQIKITSLYKGEVYESIELHFDNSSDCAMNLLPNETWIIYADWADFNVAQAVMCGHSRRMPNAGETDYYVTGTRSDFATEQKWLNDSLGIQKFADPSLNRELLHKNERPDPTQAIIYTIVGFLGLLAILYFVRRMFRKDGR